jgi:hypothetical protein
MQPAQEPRAEYSTARLRPPVDVPSEDDELTEAPGWYAVSRGAALFLGLFTMVSVLEALQQPASVAGLWWIDLGPTPPPVARALAGLLATLLIAFAVWPRMSLLRRVLLALCIVGFIGAATWNAREYYTLLRADRIRAAFPVPFALHVAAVLSVVFAGAVATGWDRVRTLRDLVTGVLTFAVCAVSLPLAHMLCFSEINDPQAADAVVVLGCLTGTEERPADQLAERVRTACELYQSGRAAKVILCGGEARIDGSNPEIDSMKQSAIGLGVPEGDIIVGAACDTTQSAVESTTALINELGAGGTVVVSHDYRLARVGLGYRGADRRVRLAAARSGKPWSDDAAAFAQEAALLWARYLSPLTGRPAPH